MMLRTALILLGLAVLAPRLLAAEPPRILVVRTQEVDRITYFQVRMEMPAELRLPGFDTGRPFSEADRRKFARLPQLVPTDGKTRAIYYRYKAAQPSLSFFGQTQTDGKAKFVLLYPLAEESGKDRLSLAELVRSPGMAEVPLQIDFATAKKVPLPVAANPSDLHISLDDLRSLWALHQAAHFAVLETQVLDFNFYSFAREATSRKYGVLGSPWVKRQLVDPEHRLYEISTGADAIAETLQLHRLLHPEARDRGDRNIDIDRVRGIEVPPQPFEKMLAGKRPEVEPVAPLIPRDNWYIRFRSIGTFLQASDLLDEWGTNITRTVEVRSRDYQLKERYEKQLCLRSTLLGKTLGPALVKSMAVTGSDPFVREGTDITVIFQVTDRALFLTGVEGFLKEAREAHGGQLRESMEDYRKVTIESFVTPLREVSLHRAAFDEFVIYSNSPAGIRRVIDAHQGLITSIARSPDFQYMRTVFPLDARNEDGFIFLSDSCIRKLVSPASRIKERRRLEALTSLQMLTNAALFTAWETGKLPADHDAALGGAGLKHADVAIPDGKVLTWDAKQRLAISDVFNTLHFATPLIELPIDKVTAQEEKEYGWFRDSYMRLWTGYFDPIAIRYRFDKQTLYAETHILPVANTPVYQSLARLPLSKMPGKPTPGTVAEMAINIDVNQNRLTFHVDEDALLRGMIERLIRWEADPGENAQREYEQSFWKLPVAVGLHVAKKDNPDQMQVVGALVQYLGDGNPREIRHRGTTITEIPISAEKYRQIAAFVEAGTRDDVFGPILSLVPTKEAPKTLYATLIDRSLYVTPNAELPKRLIDQALAKKEEDRDASQREINMRLTLSPENARQAAGLLFEYEDHCLSLLNNEVWNCFYQTGVLAPDAPEKERLATARQWLGYLPVSPSGSGYERDAKTGEVVNHRHGSYRRPVLHRDVENDSDLGRFLSRLRTIRAELKFQDNGIHAWLTIERK
jgi:hypothetical protein